ncbi:autotransporter outer membrane beta-barrel domain-containing protein [Stenotrophomonas sp. SAM-B]|uniref:autotransporter family protein n=1 Tax=Stenotrophomonas sp. SAM-B TaxID=2729141 RepID=UPI0015A34874|nr:autotransporter outer membrane beta-barrel domain-containing protein [Stenotrophomonas sp. SAM-B]NWF32589.1 autotransporter outer membrane beta-barrel domain-containing protein [Stenotrophomonas sp. SAM-B]
MSNSGTSHATDGTILIDASRVEGVSGSAITVQADRPDSTLRETSILVRNGAQLVGGNGNLLTVLNSRISPTDPSIGRLQVETTTLTGNVVAEEFAEAHVTLLSGGRINGRFDNVTSATIGDGGHWQLTGDSDVGELSLGNGGVVALGDGTAFNTLTITGDYTGSGGTLLFNTVLGDDTAASDKLIVNGSTSGQTRVAVNNVGGIGAQTVNGIQLIQVDGASNGQFDLAGRAVGGQYEYFLFKGGKADPNDGDWYLRSELPVAPPEPDPCLADPNAPGCVITLPEQCLIDPSLPQCLPPVPVLRPEPGAYLANQSAATQMFGMRMHDRNGGTARGLSERGAWARVSRNQADYGVIGDQLSVNGDTDVLQVGTDVFTWGAERGQLGVMLGSGRANNTVTSRLTGYSAKGKVDGQAIGVYGSWLQDAAQTTGLYVDAWAQHARFKNSVQGDGLSKERYDSTANSASVEAGYGVQVADGERVAMFVEPQLQLSYTRLNTDTHVERNGTVIDGDNADGLTSRFGVRFFGHAHTDAGNRVQPFVSVNWIHESSDNGLSFDGERVAGGLPQDRYEAKAGASLQLGGRWTAWGDLGLQRGDGGYKDVSGQIGLRSSW